jgi:hypothetical protein
VTVCVDGQPLQEHHVGTSEDVMTATSFIETATGSDFSVKLSHGRGFAYTTDVLIWVVYLDGVRACTDTVSRRQCH